MYIKQKNQNQMLYIVYDPYYLLIKCVKQHLHLLGRSFIFMKRINHRCIFKTTINDSLNQNKTITQCTNILFHI